MVEFSQHVKTDFFFNAEEILTQRRLMDHITLQEGFPSRRVAFLFQDDPKHWIICSHKPGGDAGGNYAVSAMPKRHYSITNAREVLAKALGG